MRASARGNDRGPRNRSCDATFVGAGAVAPPRQAAWGASKDSATDAQRGDVRSKGERLIVHPESTSGTPGRFLSAGKDAWVMPVVETGQCQHDGKHTADGVRGTITHAGIFKRSECSAISRDPHCHSLKVDDVCASRTTQIPEPTATSDSGEYAKHTEGGKTRDNSITETRFADGKAEIVHGRQTDVSGDGRRYLKHEQCSSQNTSSSSIDSALGERSSKLATTAKLGHDSPKTGRFEAPAHPSAATCEGQTPINAELVNPSDAERKAVATVEVEQLHICKLSRTLDTKPVCHYSITNTTGDQYLKSERLEHNNDQQPVRQVHDTSVISTVAPGFVPLALPAVLDTVTVPLALPRVLDTSTVPLALPRVLDTSTVPMALPRVLDTSTVPMAQPRVLDTGILPMALSRVLDTSTVPLALPRVLDTSIVPMALPRVLDTSIVPMPLPRVLDTSIVPMALPRVLDTITVPLALPRELDTSTFSRVSNVAVGSAWSSASETISVLSSTTIADHFAQSVPAERSPAIPRLCCCMCVSHSGDRTRRRIRTSGSGCTSVVGRAGAVAVALTTTSMLSYLPIAAYIVWASEKKVHETFPFENNTVFYILFITFIESILRPLVYFWRVVGCRCSASVSVDRRPR